LRFAVTLHLKESSALSRISGHDSRLRLMTIVMEASRDMQVGVDSIKSSRGPHHQGLALVEGTLLFGGNQVFGLLISKIIRDVDMEIWWCGPGGVSAVYVLAQRTNSKCIG
jgi:hypothetical protein